MTVFTSGVMHDKNTLAKTRPISIMTRNAGEILSNSNRRGIKVGVEDSRGGFTSLNVCLALRCALLPFSDSAFSRPSCTLPKKTAHYPQSPRGATKTHSVLPEWSPPTHITAAWGATMRACSDAGCQSSDAESKSERLVPLQFNEPSSITHRGTVFVWRIEFPSLWLWRPHNLVHLWFSSLTVCRSGQLLDL